MEEDVRDLKELLDVFYKEKDTTWITIHTPQIKNIENILNELDRLQKENEKLSYIISEIEQYTLDEQINEESINYNEFIEVQNMAFDGVYNKLQELLK